MFVSQLNRRVSEFSQSLETKGLFRWRFGPYRLPTCRHNCVKHFTTSQPRVMIRAQQHRQALTSTPHRSASNDPPTTARPFTNNSLMVSRSASTSEVMRSCTSGEWAVFEAVARDTPSSLAMRVTVFPATSEAATRARRAVFPGACRLARGAAFS